MIGLKPQISWSGLDLGDLRGSQLVLSWPQPLTTPTQSQSRRKRNKTQMPLFPHPLWFMPHLPLKKSSLRVLLKCFSSSITLTFSNCKYIFCQVHTSVASCWLWRLNCNLIVLHFTAPHTHAPVRHLISWSPSKRLLLAWQGALVIADSHRHARTMRRDADIHMIMPSDCRRYGEVAATPPPSVAPCSFTSLVHCCLFIFIVCCVVFSSFCTTAHCSCSDLSPYILFQHVCLLNIFPLPPCRHAGQHISMGYDSGFIYYYYLLTLPSLQPHDVSPSFLSVSGSFFIFGLRHVGRAQSTSWYQHSLALCQLATLQERKEGERKREREWKKISE